MPLEASFERSDDEIWNAGLPPPAEQDAINQAALGESVAFCFSKAKDSQGMSFCSRRSRSSRRTRCAGRRRVAIGADIDGDTFLLERDDQALGKAACASSKAP